MPAKPCRLLHDVIRALVVFLLLGSLAWAWAEAPAAPPPSSSMVEILERMAAEADPNTHAFLNRQRVELLDARLQQVTRPQDGPPIAFALAKELLYAGETEGAIRVFEQIRHLTSRPGVQPDPLIVKKLGEFLAIAYLRLGEQENCIDNHGSGTCILPIAKPYQHQRERGSRAAITELTRLVDLPEPELDHVWLFNLAWMTLGGYPDQVPERLRLPPSVFASEAAMSHFVDVAGPLGLDILAASGGTALEDFDGDGFLDIVASSWGLSDQLRYFHNQGDGTFSDWTEKAGLVGQLGGLNLNHSDFNNDGHPDVLILRGAWLGAAGEIPNSLLANNGDGTFTDVTIKAGLLSFRPTQTAAWADFDQDGWLDLFVGNESVGDYRAPCQLYRNRGDGTFVEIAAEVGLDVVGFVKGVAWGDIDNDGRPDLYLSRFQEPNLLFHNEGPGKGGAPWRFREIAAEAGVAEPLQSFPVWFWDYDNDGWLDLLVAPSSGLNGESLALVAADVLGKPSTGAKPRLYRNLGNGRFADQTREADLDKVLLAMGVNYGDLDNDGFLDAYFGTGEPNLATLVPNRMFRNDAGRRFQDVTTLGGFGHLQKGHGIAFGDIDNDNDNDGDQDIYAVLGGAFQGDVYQNALFLNPGNGNAWITLSLEGTTSNRPAIGARVRVVVSSPKGARSIHVTVGTGGSFGSSSLQQEIGLGDATSIDRVEVTWPATGQVETFSALEPRGFYLLREGTASARKLSRRGIDLSPSVAAAGRHHANQN